MASVKNAGFELGVLVLTAGVALSTGLRVGFAAAVHFRIQTQFLGVIAGTVAIPMGFNTIWSHLEYARSAQQRPPRIPGGAVSRTRRPRSFA